MLPRISSLSRGIELPTYSQLYSIIIPFFITLIGLYGPVYLLVRRWANKIIDENRVVSSHRLVLAFSSVFLASIIPITILIYGYYFYFHQSLNYRNASLAWVFFFGWRDLRIAYLLFKRSQLEHTLGHEIAKSIDLITMFIGFTILRY